MIKRFIGVALIFISVAYIPIIGSIAVSSSFSVAEKGIIVQLFMDLVGQCYF